MSHMAVVNYWNNLIMSCKKGSKVAIIVTMAEIMAMMVVRSIVKKF